MKERKFKVRSIDIWNEELQPILTGVIDKFETLKVGKDDRETMLIETGTAIIRVWHSHAVKDAFDLGEPGDGIRLHYQGTVPLAGAKTYRRVSVQVWVGGDINEILKETEANFRPIDVG